MNHTFTVLAYKESPFLEECILSLKCQMVPSRIVICTSTPNEFILSIAKQYDIPVKVCDEAEGIAADWNNAYRAAQTDLVTLAHQDDIYEPAYLAKMLEAMEGKRNPVIGFTDYYEIRGQERCYSAHSRLLKIKELMLLPLRMKIAQDIVWIRRGILSLGNAICCPSVTFNKAVIGDAPFRSDFHCDLDWDAWERLSSVKGSFCYIPAPLMGHRIHQDSTTTATIGEEHGRAGEDLAMYCRFWPAPVADLLNSFYVNAQNSNRME